MKKKFDGFDVFYKRGNIYHRCHNGVYTTREAAEERKKRYKDYLRNYLG